MKTLIVWITFFSVSSFANELTVKVTLYPAGSFEAKTTKLKGEIKKSGDKITAEQLWVKISELKTGIDLRDEHFQKHLGGESISKITLSNIEALGGKGKGVLDVNGVKKMIGFSYKNISENKIEAKFEILASQFKLKKAEYMGVGVDDKVNIEAILDI